MSRTAAPPATAPSLPLLLPHLLLPHPVLLLPHQHLHPCSLPQVKLIDLGMVGVYRPGAESMHGCMGSPGFIAPEVIRGGQHTPAMVRGEVCVLGGGYDAARAMCTRTSTLNPGHGEGGGVCVWGGGEGCSPCAPAPAPQP